jgi:hypothetical protein
MIPPADIVTALHLGVDDPEPGVARAAEVLRVRLSKMLRYEPGAVAVLLEFMADPDTWADELRDVITHSGVWRSGQVETLTVDVLVAQHYLDRYPPGTHRAADGRRVDGEG